MNPMNCDIMRVLKYESRSGVPPPSGMTPEVSPMLDKSTPTNNSIPYGYCHCGCGGKTTIASESDATRGYVGGEPKKYIQFHHLRKERVADWDAENGCYRVHLSSEKHPGMYAFVDAEDIERIQLHSWSPRVRPHRTTYAAARVNNRYQTMHLFLIRPPAGQVVDHINGDGLDNRRSNLRVATRSQNGMNRRGIPVNNKSGYIGVHWNNDQSCWGASIRVNGKTSHVGLFGTAVEAAVARDSAALELHGSFARLNFPRRKETNDEQ